MRWIISVVCRFYLSFSSGLSFEVFISGLAGREDHIRYFVTFVQGIKADVNDPKKAVKAVTRGQRRSAAANTPKRVSVAMSRKMLFKNKPSEKAPGTLFGNLILIFVFRSVQNEFLYPGTH